MSTLIIGGGGFVGLAIAEALLVQGRAVTLADRNPPPDSALADLDRLPGALDTATGDIRDGDFVRGLFERQRARVVWGAALTADAVRDATDPEGVIGTNLAALVPVLRQARDSGVGRLLNLGSGAAFGEAAFVDSPLGETDRCEPVSLYAVTKFATERLVARLAELWRFDALSVRLSAVFGPWERRTGERDTPSTLFQIARLAERGEAARLPAPAMRDWVYSRDVAAAVVALLDAASPRHRLYHVSSGRRWSALAFAERLTRDVPALDARLAGDGETPTIDLFGSRDRAPLSIARLSGELGWQPRFAALEDAFADYRTWQRVAARQ